jgi:hypothetical protein
MVLLLWGGLGKLANMLLASKIYIKACKKVI